MVNNEGKAFVTVIIILVILGIVGVVAYNMATGTDGILTKVTSDEEKYDKSEVLEEINFVIKEKYLEAYSKATVGGENKIQEFYNPEKVMAYLKGHAVKDDGSVNLEEAPTQKIYIEDLVDEKDCYYININTFKRDITTYGKGKNEKDSKDYFFIKKDAEEYKLYYKDSDAKVEEIGALVFEQEM